MQLARKALGLISNPPLGSGMKRARAAHFGEMEGVVVCPEGGWGEESEPACGR